ISGNNTGISVQANNWVIQGNYIGTDVTGTLPLGNTTSNITIAGSNNTIGGTSNNAGNVIAFAGTNGIAVSSGTGNAMEENSLFPTTGLGIDLAGHGATPNDLSPTPDADAGANNLQNFPIITVASVSGSSLTIKYSVPSDPANSTYPLRVEFFQADADGQE